MQFTHGGGEESCNSCMGAGRSRAMHACGRTVQTEGSTVTFIDEFIRPQEGEGKRHSEN